MVDQLTQIDAHEALFLLRNCFSIPKLTYFLRTAPCFTEEELLKDYDVLTKISLKKILNVQIDKSALSQCALLINLGG